ncbi:Zn-dependent hydrolase [Agromyces aerolatus]|uniref:Zn-dependent hydrolase n=1 Tax=Agromyces sp. LY-1074 TaxID=3074080 RepID=UPI0028586AB3|nr:MULTISPECIES: Zn-dependent hydrolase [unclassified Agromyces]MDR5700925.1 Zn-dependent hydrolase [Agromyces sp. LY-1074]MDR5707414.1 Zn-dependent hydrolase [Agromyces sp. LY-1358]
MTATAATPAVRIDAKAIDQLIAAFAALTETSEGVTRLGYTALERRAHALFAEEMRALGLEVWQDTAGNTIAEAPGRRPGPAVGTGSHLDSVPLGGRFDGIAGVCAGMVVARALRERAEPTNLPWRFVVFAAEEGARFGQACNGSRAAAGLVGSGDLERLVDADGTTMSDAMTAVGLAPEQIASSAWRTEDWAAFIELHIEQGTVLEASATPIGVVDAISGSSRLQIQLDGVASHTGGTPMHQRHDALAAAAECVITCERVSNDLSHHGTRVTVGRMDVQPGSITTIPGRVVFSVDVRDFDSERQRRTARLLDREFQAIAARRGVDYRSSVIGDTSPVVLPIGIVDTIAAAAAGRSMSYRLLPSGASHDAQQISRITPTGMIFVPSVRGLSHVPEEATDHADIARGAEVLFDSMLAIDARHAVPAGEAA